MPVHATRKKTRGFNQAEILARVIGKKLGIPVIPEMLVRNKKTLPQKDSRRQSGLRTFPVPLRRGEIPEGIRSVILVDDIYTTGSTIEAVCESPAGIGDQPDLFRCDLHDRGQIGQGKVICIQVIE